MSEFQCPLCGKHVSIRYYDPTNFEDDIPIIQKRGLGRGRGLEIVSKQSIFDGDYPELLDLISDRVAVIYDLLYEDIEDDDEDDSADLEDDDEEEEYEDINDFENDVID